MLFQCSRCPFKGSRSNDVAHFIFKHAPTDQVPCRCNNCNYKSVSLDRWRRHIRNGNLTKHVCITSTTPYIIGELDIIDITSLTQDKLITCTWRNNSDDTTMEDTTTREDEVIVEEIVVIVVEACVMVDPKDEKIMEHELEIEFITEKHIKEIKDIKQTHKFQCLRFGDFIERLEKKKKDLQKEVDKLTSIPKKEKKEETEQKNLKSVVHGMPKMHENSSRRLF